METVKKYLHRYFIEAMSAMALGLFATLLMGTIFKTVAGWLPVETLSTTERGEGGFGHSGMQ